ncbi:MAG: carboxypeptidase-like regulatory domain-containing protein [Acidobacteriota bacterium]
MDLADSESIELVLLPQRGVWAAALATFDEGVEAPVARARTDADGCFAIDVAEPANLELVMTARGGRIHLPIEPLFTNHHLPLTLPDLEEVRVRVVDEAGKPIAGARVVVDATVAPDVLRPVDLPTITDEQGRAVVRRAPDWYRFRIRVSHPDFLDSALAKVTEPSVELTLGRGVTRALRVVDEDERPVADAVVVVDEDLAVLRSDETGRLDLVVDPDKGRQVTVHGPGAMWQGTIAAPTDDDSAFVIRLKPDTVHTGSVVDSETKKAVADALVWSTARPRSPVRTDDEGRYRLEAPEDTENRVAALEYFPRRFAETTVELDPAVDVIGRVVDTDTKPIAGVMIESRVTRGGRELYARSDDEGVFRLAPLRPGLRHDLLVDHAGYARRAVDFRSPRRGEDERLQIEIVLSPGCVGTGWVVDESGEPLTGVAVRLGETEPSRALFEQGPPAAQYETVTSDEGRFVFDQLAPGGWDLAAELRDFVTAEIQGIEVEAPCEDTDLGTVALSRGVVVEGVIVDADEQPITGAQVDARRHRGLFSNTSLQGESVSSDGDGRFTLTGLAPGSPTTITVRRRGFAVRYVPITPPIEEPLVIALVGLGGISGKVTAEDGSEIEDMSVRPKRSSGRSEASKRFDSGAFVIDKLQAGVYQVHVKSKGFLPASVGDIQVTGGSITEDVEVTLRRGATLVGQILDPDGAPVADAAVSLDGDPTMQASSDEDGRYRLDGIESGHQVVVARHRDFLAGRGVIEVRGDVENELDLTLGRGHAVRGAVLDPSGAPAPEARVSLTAMAGEMVTTALPDADGRFEYEKVAPGTYELTASSSGDRVARAELGEPLVVAAGDVDGLVLVLEESAVGKVRGVVSGVEVDDIPAVQVFALNEVIGDMRQAQLDFEGNFAIDDLMTGDWLVWAWHSTSLQGAQRDVAIGPGGEAWVELDLTPEDGLTLRGTVRHQSQPVRGAQVQVLGLDIGTQRAATTDAAGRFVIEGIAEGSYEIWAAADGGGVWRSTRTLDSSMDLDIELQSAGLSGQITSSDGSPIARATVRLEGGSALESRRAWLQKVASSDDGGRYRIDDLPSGQVVLVVEKAGWATYREPIRIEGDSVVRDVELEPATGLRLRITRAEGFRLDRVTVALLDGAGTPTQIAELPVVAGEAYLDTAGRGAYDVLITAQGAGVVERRIDIPTAPVEIVLPPGGTVSLRVPALIDNLTAARAVFIDSSGRTLRRPDRMGRVDSEIRLYAGRATIENLTAGQWTVEVRAGDRRWRATVTVEPFTVTEIVVE